jgi:hypothetical protein
MVSFPIIGQALIDNRRYTSVRLCPQDYLFHPKKPSQNIQRCPYGATSLTYMHEYAYIVNTCQGVFMQSGPAGKSHFF